MPAAKRDTKKLILDAAEALFSERNFEAVSVREITTKAGVQLALASYHFKSKQALFEEIIARRAELLNQRRRDALRTAQQSGSPSVEQVLEAFTRPYMEFCIGAEPGWRNYSRLIAQIAQDSQWLPLIERHFNATALIFVDALCEALPEVPREGVLRAFVFSIQLMVSAFSNNQRVDTLSHGGVAASDLEATFAVLIPFLAGGFHTLPSAQAAANLSRRKAGALAR
ncbi:MAG: TetR/AcrR family transcriptional regulator [Burkholderiales bacterium]